ncbi:MAG: TraB/GumN family protein [Crocinitomicaceae bacterium]|nr:TraB/GumN family protein [Crocinitomicaceae bacterium]
MNNFLFLANLFLFLLLGSSVTAQDTSVREFPMEDRALLWKIEGNGIKTKSYLFGTVHLIDEEEFFFPKKLQKIVAKSEVLTMEIAGIPDPMEAFKLSMLDSGSFFDFFTEDQADSILNWVEENTALSPAAFKLMAGKMRPFVVAQFLPEIDKNNPSPGMDGKKSYEIELEAIAKKKDLEIEGLETVAEQMGIFDLLTNEQQVAMVMEIIRNGNADSGEELAEIMELYSDQDIDGLYQMIAGDGELMEMNDILLDNRNKRWVPMIEQMIKEKSTFIAVGAGHLGGPNGVLRLLETQGYTLKPIEL